MKKLFLLLSAILWLVQIDFAQIGAVSHDSKHLVTFMLEGGLPKLYVHEIQTGKLLRKIPLKVRKFQTIGFSPKDNFIYLTSDNVLYIYRSSDGKLVKKYYRIRDFRFTQDDNTVFAISNGLIFSFNFKTGSEIKYQFNLRKQPWQLVAMPDGRLFGTITTDGWLVIWQMGQPAVRRFLHAHTAVFTTKQLITLIRDKHQVWVKVYDLPRNSRDSLRLLKQVQATELLHKNSISPVGLNPQNSELSPDGSHIALFVQQGYKRTVALFDVPDFRLVGRIDNSQNPSYTLYPMHWTADKLIVETGDLNALEYSLLTGKIARLYWRMLNPQHSPKLAPSEQLKHRRFSPDYHYVVMPVQPYERYYLLVRDATIDKRQISYPDANFVAFSPDSKQLFLEVKGFIFVLPTSEIKKSMLTNSAATLRQLGSVVATSFKEPLIPTDKPPKGYKYVFSTQIKPVTQVDTAKLFVLFRGINLNPNNVELKLNLIDQNGNIITGATDPHWLYLWCKLLIMNKELKVDQSNFVVREVHEKQPTAYALVLDHSGSMGDFRANALQYGALQLITHKQPKDAFLLIKYDNRVKLLVNLTTNKSAFYRYLNNTGLQGFGGATALNDAAFLAIEKLAKAPYKKRVLILFTDGQENSSIHSKQQVIQSAIQNGVEIFTIGFGKEVNDSYLQDLAYLTGGAYYHIYRTEELRKIFQDVDIKRRYYYKFDFTTKHPGKYIALLQLCQNFKHHDSLVVEFSNVPNQTSVRVDPPLSPVQKQKFRRLQIPRKPPEKPVTDKKIVQEFEQIDFPNIYFAFDSDRIIKSEEKGLREIADFMRHHPDVYLLIEGHTDSVGSYEYNIDLSKRRAEAAKRLLVKYGIAPGRIFTKGYGYTRPLATNKTEEGRAKNRRIEFKIFRY